MRAQIRKLPRPAAPGRVRYFYRAARGMRGQFPRECTACTFQGRFRGVGLPPRYDALCPRCDSLERHRLVYLMVQNGQLEISGDVLHFAPEPSITNLLRGRSASYVSADIEPGVADVVLNMEDLDRPDESVDLIFASHVLEHVDDSKALPELTRILRPTGRIIIMVPLIEGWETSYENPDIKTDDQRLLHFGQADHVRYFGRDLVDRLRNNGLEVQELSASPEECVKYGLTRGEKIFIATKPAN